MNLLVLSTWFPYPPGNGSRIRAYFLLRELVRAGHTIRLVAGLQNDLMSQDKDAGIAALREMGIAEVVAVPWEWLGDTKPGLWSHVRAAFSPTPRAVLDTPNPALSQVIAEQIARPYTDAVLVMETGMDAYLPKRLPPDLPLILDGAEVAAWAELDARATAQKARARKARRYWQKQFARYSVVTTVSEIEADALRGLLSDNSSGPKIAVVPNGVDVAAYAPRDWSAVVPGRLIFNGSITYGPNRAAVLYFVADILPRLIRADCHLWITGRTMPDDAAMFALYASSYGKTIHLTGFVPDVRPLLARAAVCVVPLSHGGGTRLKILEAWAAGVPVVSTVTGATGLEGAVPYTHYLHVADLPNSSAPFPSHKAFWKARDEGAENFARATVRLLTEPDLAQRLSENARALVVERYDWSRFGKQLSELLVETCRDRKPSL